MLSFSQNFMYFIKLFQLVSKLTFFSYDHEILKKQSLEKKYQNKNRLKGSKIVEPLQHPLFLKMWLLAPVVFGKFLALLDGTIYKSQNWGKGKVNFKFLMWALN